MIMKRKLKEVTIKKTPWPLFSHFSSPFLETLEQKNNIRIGNYPCINACLPNFRRSKSFFFPFFLVQENVTILCSFMILQYFCKWFSVYYLNFLYLLLPTYMCIEIWIGLSVSQYSAWRSKMLFALEYNLSFSNDLKLNGKDVDNTYKLLLWFV